jgi:ankyrin repeat protein
MNTDSSSLTNRANRHYKPSPFEIRRQVYVANKLIDASKSADFKVIDKILETDPNAINYQNDRGDTAYIIAARDGKRQTILELQARNANPLIINHQGQTARLLAESKGRTEAVILLAQIEQQWKTAQEQFAPQVA